ncbi:SpoIIE family protein phosphatase [Streptomyces sp. NPDC090025]|uniref:SpoIIE family protein phosphatase n=1 Tax=Streptomyces sp. NPDC090025 TaxID=3365922 RepID=UPI0038396592
MEGGPGDQGGKERTVTRRADRSVDDGRTRPTGLRSVAGQVFALQAVIALLIVAAAAVALVLQGRYDSERDARNRSLAVAEAFAHAPGTAEALKGPDPTAVLQPRAEAARKASGVDFIAVLAPDGVRFTDSDAGLIGQKASGDVGRAARGESFTEIFHGAPNDAVRAVVPIRDTDGSVVGMVSSGIEVETVGQAVQGRLPLLLGAAAGGLALAVGGAGLVSARLRRQTHGLGPAEMTRLKEHHEAVLHAVKEGVVIVAGDGRLVLANDEARRLLRLPEHAERSHVRELGLDPRTAHLLLSGRAATDEVHLAGDRLLAVNVRPTGDGAPDGGVVMTMRDTTELAALTGRAEVARGRLRLLYEAGTRIGTTLDVVRTAEELSEVAVPRFADFVTVELLDPVVRGEEPSGAFTEMRRTALSGVRTETPLQPVGDLIRFVVPTTPMASALAEGRAVIQPDLAAAQGWRAQDPEGAARALEFGLHSLLTVPLLARGVVLGMANFWRGPDSPEPFGEEDLSFAEELAARAALAIDNARRFTREHSMAVALQRSLLPRVLPEQSAMRVAYRYLPATAGVGGDWFDVIPLPGARVALVVGDVVGHGLHAAATMGRLRTAVANFSTLDLPPEELLSHLDELIDRLGEENEQGGGEGGGPQAGGTGAGGAEARGMDGATDAGSGRGSGTAGGGAGQDPAADGRPAGGAAGGTAGAEGTTGATCLYAIYDPTTGACTMASAGHPGPALVRPDGSVEFPAVPAGLPLGIGLGDRPFESVRLRLEPGSKLVLFTDGLIEDRHRDYDTGLGLLRGALARPDRSPEQTCADVLAALLLPVPADDIALLVASAHRIPADRIAEWEVPAEPSAVSRVRTEAAARLAAWGLADVGFTAELVLSELITNAIRYGRAPVRVRLVHDRVLICEVSDGSSTSPHLRHAADTDEGGRGLFLVAQFAQRWGTRYARRGKTIWAELPVSPDPAGGDGAGPLFDPDALEDLAW